MKPNRPRPAPARAVALLALALLVGACASPRPPAEPGAAGKPPGPQAGAGRGAYYLDDGPGEGAPVDLDAIPDAVPRIEPLHPRANRPYEVFGRQYVPMTSLEPYRRRGVASWYGRKYNGRRTSTGEPYDMYAMTAAHPTLPLPSYVRVTHVRNGRSVVLRVNDRGPFLNDRLIDLSWTAAAKLGFVQAGSAEVDVELITVPDAPASIAQGAADAPPVLSMTPVPAAAPAGQPARAAQGAADAPLALTMTPVPAAVPAAQPAATPVATPAAQPARAAQGGSAPPAAVGAAATAPAAASPASASPAVAPSASGTFLQFAALSSMDGAQAMRERIARELAWLADRLQVRVDGGMFKVLAGPWAGRDEALAAAERVRQASAYRPMPVTR